MPLIYYWELIGWENPSVPVNRLSGICPWLGGSVLGWPGEPVCTSAGKPLSSLLTPLQPSDDSPHRPTQTHRQLASTRPPPLRHPSAGRRAGFLPVKLLSGSLHVPLPCSVLIVHLPWKGGWEHVCEFSGSAYAETAFLARGYGIKQNLACKGGEGDGTPLQYSCLENPMDGGAW